MTMTKVHIEMNDTLDEHVDNIKTELEDNVIEYFTENPDTDDWDTYYQAQGADAIHEIVDSNTPIYTGEINDLLYIYREEAEDAYRNAGIGDGTEDNHGQVMLYCLLEEKAWERFGEIEDDFEEWQSLGDDPKPTFAVWLKEKLSR
jgi:hypothetical protein